MKSVCLKKWQIILYETVKSKFYKGCLILQSVFSQFFISCKYSSLRLRWCENIVVTYNKNIATTNMYTIICYVINYGSFVRLIIHRLKAFIKKIGHVSTALNGMCYCMLQVFSGWRLQTQLDWSMCNYWQYQSTLCSSLFTRSERFWSQKSNPATACTCNKKTSCCGTVSIIL